MAERGFYGLSPRIKSQLLIGVSAVVFIAVFFLDPIPQDPRYHQFADQLTLAGIPNLWNVLSSSAFMLAGMYGLVGLVRCSSTTLSDHQKTLAWIFYGGLILTGLGSGYYHLQPSNETLVWDRLAMTVAFMAFFSFVVSMHISQRAAKRLLWPLLAIGITSVVYWAYTESIGRGDLRLYAIVQFLPGILIPLILLMFPSTHYKPSYVWLILALYSAAKLAEHFDHQLYDLIPISGHTLKHLIAASTGVIFWWAVKVIRR